MKNKALKIFIILISVLLLFVACDKSEDSDDKIKVMLAYGEGVTVKGENPVWIQPGDTASFDVSLDDTYAFANLTHGTYENGCVTVEGLTRNTTVKFFAEDLGYSTSEDYRYFFNGEANDASTIGTASVLKGGTKITVTAGEKFKIFLGWSFNKNTVNKNEMISTEREFTFRVSPDIANAKKIIRIYANYMESGIYYYDLNGGNLNTGTANMQENGYYKLSRTQEKLKVSMSGEYLEIFESVPLFYDDGSFERDGYVLTEYNTEPDGSGTAYSLGSRYYISSDDGSSNVLYCIWEKAETSESFTCSDFNYPCPTEPSRAAHWKENGVIITSYNDNSEKVVIPEKINGKYVTGIASGAFTDKDMKTLVLPKTIQRIESGAFVSCESLETVYFPDSIYDISNESFDESSYTSFKNLYVNATMAPRYAKEAGMYSVKLSRLLASADENRIIVIAGSSTYQGLSSSYLETLLSGDYTVINFGTTRTTHGLIYLEAMQTLAHEGDIVIYAPENSSYMLGETELYWKTLRDLESMYNFYRYVDFSNYTNIFGAFADFNQNYRYKRKAQRFESSYDVIASANHSVNEYGEYQNPARRGLSTEYVDSYYITLNNRIKSKYEGEWNDTDFQGANNNYKDPDNITWVSMDSEVLANEVNRVIAKAKLSGAKICFSFCPVDADKLVEDARSYDWMLAYDDMIEDVYDFDGVVGSSVNYVFAHEYFYDNAFHLNDIGRAYRTYRMYLDIAELLSFEPRDFLAVGTRYEGCIFEGESGEPLISVDFDK